MRAPSIDGQVTRQIDDQSNCGPLQRAVGCGFEARPSGVARVASLQSIRVDSANGEFCPRIVTGIARHAD